MFEANQNRSMLMSADLDSVSKIHTYLDIFIKWGKRQILLLLLFFINSDSDHNPTILHKLQINIKK